MKPFTLRRPILVLLLTLLTGCNRGVSFSPDAKRLVVATYTGLLVMKTDGTGKYRIPDTSSADKPCWSPDGRFIVWCKNGYDLNRKQTADTWLLDLSTGKTRELAHSVWGPYVWREDGRRLVGHRFYSTNGVHPTELVWLDVAQGEMMAVTAACETSAVIAWLPGTDDVILIGGSSDRSDLYLVEAGECKRVTSTGDVLGAGISDNGERLVWLRGKQEQSPTPASLFALDLHSRVAQRLPFPQQLPVKPPKRGHKQAGVWAHVSPDGKQLAVLSFYTKVSVQTKPSFIKEGYEMCSVMNRDGTGAYTLSFGRQSGKAPSARMFDATWSKDGKKLALQEIIGEGQGAVSIYEVGNRHERVIYREPRR